MNAYNTLSDQELIALLKGGDREAFNQIYSRHVEFLYNYAFNMLKDEDECTDAVQDIFAWLWLNRQKLHITSLKGYLGAAVKYKLARVIQRSKRRAEILAANADLMNDSFVDDSFEIKELKKVISDFVGDLPERARQIFELSRNQYLSNKEIAARLGITEKTVENQITITLKKLKVSLGKMSFWVVFL